MVNNSNNTNNFSPQTIEHNKKTKTYGIGNPGPDLGQAQKCGGVKLVYIPVSILNTKIGSKEVKFKQVSQQFFLWLNFLVKP